MNADKTISKPYLHHDSRHIHTRKKAPAFSCKCLNHKGLSRPFPWSHLGLNQGPPDYESGATNQLSYGTYFPVKYSFFYCAVIAYINPGAV